jgi:hypothetical protein
VLNLIEHLPQSFESFVFEGLYIAGSFFESQHCIFLLDVSEGCSASIAGILTPRHCERSEAIHLADIGLDCFASLAMTNKSRTIRSEHMQSAESDKRASSISRDTEVFSGLMSGLNGAAAAPSSLAADGALNLSLSSQFYFPNYTPDIAFLH